MMKRLVWLSSGYVAGAASGWYVTRRVKRAAERVLPSAVRSELATRAGQIGRMAAPLPDQSREFFQRVRHVEIDLTDRVWIPDRVRSRA
jgi:hypothetical protein